MLQNLNNTHHIELDWEGGNHLISVGCRSKKKWQVLSKCCSGKPSKVVKSLRCWTKMRRGGQKGGLQMQTKNSTLYPKPDLVHEAFPLMPGFPLLIWGKRQLRPFKETGVRNKIIPPLKWTGKATQSETPRTYSSVHKASNWQFLVMHDLCKSGLMRQCGFPS